MSERMTAKPEKMLKKDRTHQRYYIEENGKKIRVPGVTTICGINAKPALIGWANKMGLDGIDTRSYVDSRANMGTCAHDMVEAFLLGKEPYLDEFSKVEIESAESSLLSFHESMKGVEYKLIGLEIQLVSKHLRCGGTIDIYWEYNGKKRLTDLKTSKTIYPDQWTQVAAYWGIMLDNGLEVDEVSILNIPRAEDEEFLHPVMAKEKLQLHLERFRHSRAIYDLNKSLGINQWRS